MSIEMSKKEGEVELQNLNSPTTMKVAVEPVDEVVLDQQGVSPGGDEFKPEANYIFLNAYVLALGLGGMQLGWGISGNN